MTGFTEIEWETCFVEPGHDPQLESYVRNELGRMPAVALYFLPCPWVVRTMVGFNETHFGLQHVDNELGRLIHLVVSQDNSCRYCYAASRAMLKIIGYSEKRIRGLEQDLLTAELNPRMKVALEFSRRVSRANPLAAAADTSELRGAGYPDAAIKELTFLAAVCVYFNRLATLPAVPSDSVERFERSWTIKLFRPLMARFMTRRARTLPPVPADLGDTPFAYVIRAFAGLGVASPLYQSVIETWQSPQLPRRTKAILFAVVARGLGCPLAEKESTRLLHVEGLAAHDVETILANLASPMLDAVETIAVPFARETIRYRPIQIQRRARGVKEQLTLEQFLAVIGIVALANALCRMSVTLVSQ